jgi:1-aminocyclopropane-1-carboxylate deaminase
MTAAALADAPPITRLADQPVLGVSLGQLRLLRLDQLHVDAPGNKWFKLEGWVARAREEGVRRLLSCGGAWSNHLHALAAVGHREGFETVGIVRGEASQQPSATLRDAAAWGMKLVHVTRAEYRRRGDPAWQAELTARFAPCHFIPEGGAAATGVSGSRAIGALVRDAFPRPLPVYVAVGSGTTLAGMALELGPDWTLTGVSALRGTDDLQRAVTAMAGPPGAGRVARWRILGDAHCGGFARVSAGLRDFMLAFEAVQGIPLEPVYTGKLLFALHTHLRLGRLPPGQPVLAIHSGGLQGRRGFPWLAGAAGGVNQASASPSG